MRIEITNEVMKAGFVMSRYHMSKDDQKEVVRILMNAGIEHCLQEQERIRETKDAMIEHAQKSYRGMN